MSNYISFYVESKKHILVNGEKQENGYIECRVYETGRYGPGLRGSDARHIIIELENGLVIKTNDLWYIPESWTNGFGGSMLGTIIDDTAKVAEYDESEIHYTFIFPSTK